MNNKTNKVVQENGEDMSAPNPLSWLSKLGQHGEQTEKDLFSTQKHLNPEDVEKRLRDENIIPSNDPTPDDVDTMLASELSKMKIDEREQLYEELHGVDQEFHETPELISEKLREFDEALHQINHKPAYEEAESMSAEYTKSPKLRLMFLRADCFDAKKAAKRFVAFFQGKLENFGKKCLARPIYLSDLDKDDMACLKAGYCQILAARDRSGRAIYIDMMNPEEKSYKEVINMVRTPMLFDPLVFISPDRLSDRFFLFVPFRNDRSFISWLRLQRMRKRNEEGL